MSAAKAKTAQKEPQAEKPAKAAKAAKAPKVDKKVVDIKDAPQKKGHKPSSEEKLISLLLAPHITEKTSLAMQNSNTYSFRVRRDSTKPDIKAAVELMFSVKVDGVQVVNETGKSRRSGKLQGRTQDIKKAYVRLAPGQTIDYEAKLKA
jgi:large subunit ribosomal protein L23